MEAISVTYYIRENIMPLSRTYSPSIEHLNFRTNLDNKKTLQNISRQLGITESELINRMIFVFKNLDPDMISCLLISHVDSELK